jgi:hypothetical protein
MGPVWTQLLLFPAPFDFAIVRFSDCAIEKPKLHYDFSITQ